LNGALAETAWFVSLVTKTRWTSISGTGMSAVHRRIDCKTPKQRPSEIDSGDGRMEVDQVGNVGHLVIVREATTFPKPKYNKPR